MVLAARSVDKLTGVAKEVEGFGVKALAVGCDVTKSADVATTVAQAWGKFGRVDVLINNAGVIKFRHGHDADR